MAYSAKKENYNYVVVCIIYAKSNNLVFILLYSFTGRVIDEENLFLLPVIPTTQPPSTIEPTVTSTTEAPTIAPTEDDWVPIFLDELDFTDEQRMVCRENIQCQFDWNVTDSMDLGVATLNHSVETEETREIIGKLCSILFQCHV